MARPLRIEFPDAVFHVTSRGNRREAIFRDDADRERFLRILVQGLERFDAVVLAYCLMGNHYHLVVQTRRANLARLMRHVNGVYAQSFNRRHGLVGHVFQGRYGAILVDRDAYLLEVCRYTELNPVRAGLAKSAGAWRWSSYRQHCGLAAPPPWLDTSLLHGHLLGRDPVSAKDRTRAARRYAHHVAEGRGGSLWTRSLRQQIYLGDEAFVARTLQRARLEQRACREVPRTQRRMPLARATLPPCAVLRGEAFHRAYVEDGRTLSDMAQESGLSMARVSRLMAVFEARHDPPALGRDVAATSVKRPAT